MFLNCDVSDVSLMSWLGLGYMWWTRCNTVDGALAHLAELAFARFLHLTLSVPSPPPRLYCALWNRVTMCDYYFWVGSPAGVHKLLGILLPGSFVFFSLIYPYVFTSLNSEWLAQEWGSGRHLIYFIGSCFRVNLSQYGHDSITASIIRILK